MRILHTGGEERAAYLQKRASQGVVVDSRRPEGGPGTIESMYDEYLYIPGLLDVVKKGEEDGYDAVVTSCFGDPGIDAARELVEIPVVGPGEAAMLVAAMLGASFSIVTVLDSVVRPLQKLAKVVGVGSKLASVRVVGEPVAAIRENKEAILPKAIERARQCVKEDGADVIVMGCGSMSFYAEEIEEAVGVPVVNPLLTACQMAEALVGAGLSHSKRAYPTPNKLKDN